jgi:hypothetical protein
MAVHIFGFLQAACKLNNPQASHEFFAPINYRIKTAF